MYASCPHCESLIAYAPHQVGQDHSCPNCGHVLTLPDSGTSFAGIADQLERIRTACLSRLSQFRTPGATAAAS